MKKNTLKNKMKKHKVTILGFTLIELLAVIIILVVIALITIPIALNTIENTKKEAKRNSVYGLLDSAKLYYAESMLDESKKIEMNGTTNILDKISISGDKPDSGEILINSAGEISILVVYDNTCYIKNYDEEEVREIENNIYECSIPTLDIWDGTIEEITPVGETYYVLKGSHLAWISKQVENGETFEGKTIVIKNNINMGAEFDEEGNLLNDSKYKFTPIGYNDKAFYGNIDGRNNYISNLYIVNNEEFNFVGLIGRYYGETFKNLTVKNSYIESNGGIVGIIGGNRSDSPSLTIENVKSIDNKIIAKGKTVGGIIGQLALGNANNNYNSSKVVSKAYFVGGIAGRVNGTLSNNVNYGQVTSGTDSSGGIAGQVLGGTLSNNINYGQVTSGTYGSGGIAGTIKGVTLSNNINYGTVQGEEKWIGGIVGINSEESLSIVSNNINEGKVTTLHGAFRVGGIVGNANDNILVYNNINKGEIDGIGDGTANSYGAGGIVGTIGNDESNNPFYILNCYNEGIVKGNLSAGGIVGNFYDSTTSQEVVKNVYNTGTVESPNGYGGGIIGKMNDHLTLTKSLEEIVNGSYNSGIVKGKYAAGLVGANVGISNSINYILPTGINNYGVIAHTNGIEKIENIYYINTATSNYGTPKTDIELNNDFLKTVLGTISWDYSGTYPKLYKIEANLVDGKLNVNYLSETLN